MVAKFITAVLYGSFISFVLHFSFFAGVYINYIKHYRVLVYYNVLFADNANLIIYLISSLLFGLLFIYINNKIANFALFLVVLILSALPFISSVGRYIGEYMFYEESFYKTKKERAYDLLYSGRGEYILYDKERDIVFSIDKEDLR